MGVYHTNLLKLGEFVDFKMQMNSGLWKARLPLKLSFVYIKIL